MKREICAAVCASFVMSGAVHAQERATFSVIEGGGEESQSAYYFVGSPVIGDGMSMRSGAVQLFGELEPSIVYSKGTGAPTKGGDEAAATQMFGDAYWGLRGAEDLGSGWQLVFQYETETALGTGSNVNPNNGNLMTETTFIGVQNDKFGVLEMGYLDSPLTSTLGRVVDVDDPFQSVTDLLTTLNGTSNGFADPTTNSVLYSTSKDSDGLVGHFFYSHDNQTINETTGASTVGSVYTLSASYGAGPLYLQYAYESRTNEAKGLTNWAHRLVGRYAFTPTLAAAFAVDYSASDGTYGTKAPDIGPGRISRQAATISLAKNFGRNTLTAWYAYARGIQCTGAANGSNTQCMAGNQSSTAAQSGSLVYNYSLSKRTFLSASVSRIWNRSQGLYDFSAIPVVASKSDRTPGVKPTGIAVGITHVF